MEWLPHVIALGILWWCLRTNRRITVEREELFDGWEQLTHEAEELKKERETIRLLWLTYRDETGVIQLASHERAQVRHFTASPFLGHPAGLCLGLEWAGRRAMWGRLPLRSAIPVEPPGRRGA